MRLVILRNGVCTKCKGYRGYWKVVASDISTGYTQKWVWCEMCRPHATSDSTTG